MNQIKYFLKRNIFTIFLFLSIVLIGIGFQFPLISKNIFDLMLLKETDISLIITYLINFTNLVGIVFLLIAIATNGNPKYRNNFPLSIIFFSIVFVLTSFNMIYQNISVTAEQVHFDWANYFIMFTSLLSLIPFFILNFVYLAGHPKAKKILLIISLVIISIPLLLLTYTLVSYNSKDILTGENRPFSYFFNLFLLPFFAHVGILFLHINAFHDNETHFKRSEENLSVEFLKINYLLPIVFAIITLFSIRIKASDTPTLLDLLFGFLIFGFIVFLILKEKQRVGKLQLYTKIFLVVISTVLLLLIGFDSDITNILKIAYLISLIFFIIYIVSQFFPIIKARILNLVILIASSLLIILSFYIIFIRQYTYGGFLLFLNISLFTLSFVKVERVVYVKKYEKVSSLKLGAGHEYAVNGDINPEAVYITPILKAFFFPIITLGIYQLIWVYRLIKTHVYLEKGDHTGATKEFLLFIFVPFYSIYWLYKKEKSFFTLRKKASTTNSKHNIYLIFSLFGFGGVCLLFFLNDTNEYVERILSGENIDVNPEIPSATTDKNIRKEEKNDVYEKLQNLKKYFDEGLITAEEYERKRNELLDK